MALNLTAPDLPRTGDNALTAHPLADIFPMLDAGELRELADDIRANGLADPIIILDGQILDGRNRYAACRAAGVDARFEIFSGADPAAFVVSRNLRRRHLTASQRAMAAAKLANIQHGGDRSGGKEQTADLRLEGDGTRSPRVSIDAAAKAMNVSPRLTEAARVVEARGAPVLQEAVARGAVSVSAAERLARSLAKEEQEEVAAGGAGAVTRMAASLRKSAAKAHVPASGASPIGEPEQTEIWRAEDVAIALARRNGGELTLDAAAMRHAAGYRLRIAAHPVAKGLVLVRAEVVE